MVDIHHHLLPGLDDGSADLASSVEMARMAANDGITHIVCTPHASGRYKFDPDVVGKSLQDLREAVAAEHISITLGSGCDFHLSYDNVEDSKVNPNRYTINGHSYLLIELSDRVLSPGLEETFYNLRVAGMTPILTHPERNTLLQRDISRLAGWIQRGMLVQVTTSSVLGRMGKTAEKLSHQLLADKWVHFLASDAHNLTSRPPRMKEACELVSKRYGSEYAERLCTANPLAVFEGRPLGAQDEPQRLERYTEQQPSWWQRILGISPKGGY